ncbi:phosphodiesterase [Mycobacterium sp. ITM-2016-00316]|uniref:phosphodiesterase n=1 Tax=Mycobacterium sp. ITM-2016-00316 TaxID=2099695 RepID=UPI000CF8E154|nr:phosphodiesterase [Mycobacterium sp. ITM-2016-00316]WNG79841.1 phosphodiesterase [Mycobacterium sp. ITM-2016-00316]
MKASDLLAWPMKLGAEVRHRRVFHPVGVLASGRIVRTAPAGPGLPIESSEVLGRVSKAIGIPGDLPDLIGLAWRMPTHALTATPWDVLMASTGTGILARFGLQPTRSWTDTTLSTLMPLRYHDGWWWLKAELQTKMPDGLSLELIEDEIDNSEVIFDIQQAHGTGPFEPLATLTLSATIPTDDDHDVSFDPTRNTIPGVELGPQWLTTLREQAYRRSREGRDAPDEAALV